MKTNVVKDMENTNKDIEKKKLFKAAHDGRRKDIRKIGENEIVLEHDHCKREEGLELLKFTEKKLGDKYKYEVWDHGGKSPHIHIYRISGLESMKPKERREYKKAFLLKYAGDPERVDLSLASEKSLIAKEGEMHWKVQMEGKKYGKKERLKIANADVSNIMEELPLPNTERGYSSESHDGGVVELAQQHGHEVDGSNLMFCLFHKEDTPSMKLYPETGTTYSFCCNKWLSYQLFKKELESCPPEDIGILRDPDLLDIICDQIERKVAGDRVTVKFVVVALCSVLVKGIEHRPNLMVSCPPSSGKSYLIKKVCEFFDLIGRVETYTKITPQALAYLHANEKEFTWDNKLLYVEDAQQVLMNSETFKVFITEGVERTASVKDNESQVICIRGQPTIFTTTATVNLGEEMSHRFITINIDETHGQTGKVLTYAGKYAATVNKPHYDGQIKHVLKGLVSVPVVIPYAERIVPAFHLHALRVRRDFPRFLSLIMGHAALYQHQREITPEGFVVANGVDYEAVCELYKNKVLDSENFYGLSHTEQKALSKCKTLIKEKGPLMATEIEAGVADISLPGWMKRLKKFCEAGLLKKQLMVNEYGKEVWKYSIGAPEKVELNSFNLLFEDGDDFTSTTPDTSLLDDNNGSTG